MVTADKPQGESPRPADAIPDHSKDRTNHDTYTVERGDTLWGISKHYYGDGTKWWALYGANGKAIEKQAQKHGYKGSGYGHWIFPKTGIAIPDPDVAEANEQNLEEALRTILLQHPAVFGSVLCPNLHEGDPEDFLTCLDNLKLLGALIAQGAGSTLFLREVATAVWLRLATPFILCVVQGDNPEACPAALIINQPQPQQG